MNPCLFWMFSVKEVRLHHCMFGGTQLCSCNNCFYNCDTKQDFISDRIACLYQLDIAFRMVFSSNRMQCSTLISNSSLISRRLERTENGNHLSYPGDHLSTSRRLTLIGIAPWYLSYIFDETVVNFLSLSWFITKTVINISNQMCSRAHTTNLQLIA